MSKGKESSGTPKKVFDFFVGCAQILSTVIGVIALIVSVIGLIWVVRNQEAASQIVEVIAGVPTSTPIVITLPSDTPQPTYTLPPTQTSQVIVVTATALPKTATPLPSATPDQITLFSDDFNTGISNLWEIEQGNPLVVNDRLTTNGKSWLFIGDSSWTNYEVIFEGESHGAPNFQGVRVVDMDNMIVFSWAAYVSKWYIVQNGVWTEIPGSGGDGVRNMAQVRITVEGDKFTAHIGGKKVSSLVSSIFPQGLVAVGLDGNAIVDNFMVLTLEP